MLTSTTLNSRRQQRGITLIEVSIGLIIAAIIAAAAFIAFQNNSRRTEVRDNIRLLTEIISESQQKVGLPTGYAGYTETVALNSGTLESLVNSYGGDILIAEVAGTAGERATLTWENIPEDQCIDLLTGIEAGTVRLAAGAAGATDAKNIIPGETEVLFTVASADAACIDDLNIITAEFGRR